MVVCVWMRDKLGRRRDQISTANSSLCRAGKLRLGFALLNLDRHSMCRELISRSFGIFVSRTSSTLTSPFNGLWLFINSLLSALTIALLSAMIIRSSLSPGLSVRRCSVRKKQVLRQTKCSPGLRSATAEKSPSSFSVSLSSAMLFAKANAADTSFFSDSSVGQEAVNGGSREPVPGHGMGAVGEVGKITAVIRACERMFP